MAITEAAVAQTGGSSQENESFPATVVPEIITNASVGGTLVTNRSVYALGAPVFLKFTIVNNSKSKVKYEFDTTQKFDVQISNSAGMVVWTWSKNKMFKDLVTDLDLAPGTSKDFVIKWNQRNDNDIPVPTDTYTVLAVLKPMDRPKISGNLFANPNNDPVNTGMPTMDAVETGAVNIKNTTPPVYAKATFKVETD